METSVAHRRTGPRRAERPVEIPFIRPNPPKLSAHLAVLEEVENSGIFSNYGPANSRLEERIAAGIFNAGHTCVTVANATLGLMLAVKQAVGWRPRKRYALMPSFTFAAAAQAALWCGLTPLLCDVDRETWLPDPEAEDALLAQYGDDIAVLLPNATFGNCLDLQRYHRVSAARGIPLVVDAAASLGSLDADDKPFGLGSQYPLIFSMHATKAFATAEGGIVYCADRRLIATLRAMGNFGFGEPRTVTMPGLNSKLSEITSLLGLLKLDDFDAVVEHRQDLFDRYRSLLPEFTFQRMTGRRTAHQFVSVLVPEALAGRVGEIVAALARQGVGAARYFVPHLAQQPFFQATCVAGDLAVTEAISRRVIALPMSDTLTEDEVGYVCDVFRHACSSQSSAPRARVRPIKSRLRNLCPEDSL
ncbi:MAG TPA: DegT/DnrJ/EryC1/StrS family aminotransferase [Stellaceae bacterium]|nr:DegT/DnrJ/EryC1/StrS family aminotransferase [Stellaceae bacterium]